MIDYYLPYSLNYVKWFFISLYKSLIVWLFVTLFMIGSRIDFSMLTFHFYISVYFHQLFTIKFLIVFVLVMLLTKSEIPGKLPRDASDVTLYVLLDSVLFEPIQIAKVNKHTINYLLNNDELTNDRKIIVDSEMMQRLINLPSIDAWSFENFGNGLSGVDRTAIKRINFNLISHKEKLAKTVISGLKPEFAKQIPHVWISKSTNTIYYELYDSDLQKTPYLYNLSMILSDVIEIPFAGYEVIDFIETIPDYESDLIKVK